MIVKTRTVVLKVNISGMEKRSFYCLKSPLLTESGRQRYWPRKWI